MTTLDLSQIQSEIVRGYQRGGSLVDPIPRRAVYLLFELRHESGDTARAWVKELAALVTSAASWRPSCTLNVGFTWSGLQVLGHADPCVYPAEFQAGMAARAADVLADVDASAPDRWQFSDGDAAKHVDAIVMIQGNDDAAIDATVEQVRKLTLQPVVTLESVRLKDNRENFGFVDGISQPAFEGLGAAVNGYGAATEEGGWRAIKVGELVLGYDDEDGPWAGHSLLANGTFLALRKLQQDVGRFRRYVDARAAALGTSSDEIESKIVGRDRHGKPILPNAVGPNDFGFASDPNGFSCPHGAHIRRANPRDVLDRVGDRAERHRIARRALMYAERNGASVATPDADPPAGDDDGVERGMVFGAFNASLSRQFEFVQGNWLNQGGTAPARLLTFRDPLTGANEDGYFVLPGDSTRVLRHLPSFVTTKGGGYFFMPGLSTLNGLWHLPGRRQPPPPPGPRPLGKLLPRMERLVGDLLRFSGLRCWPPVPKSEKKTAPERQLLLAMAPLRDPDRARALLANDKKQQLDALFASVEHGGAHLVHHARFVVVPSFKAWLCGDDGPVDVCLPNGDSYLFFACWFDGEEARLYDALAAALRHVDKSPFDCCWRFPKERDAGAIARFFKCYRLPTSFLYRAYDASTEDIEYALGVRMGFVDTIEELTRTRAHGLVETFLNGLRGAQPRR